MTKAQQIADLEARIKDDRQKYRDMMAKLNKLPKGQESESVKGGMAFIMQVVRDNEKRLQELRQG